MNEVKRGRVQVIMVMKAQYCTNARFELMLGKPEIAVLEAVADKKA